MNKAISKEKFIQYMAVKHQHFIQASEVASG